MIDKSMEEEQLVIACTIDIGSCRISTCALVDTGATGISFIDERFARHHNLPLHKLTTPREVEVIDGRPIRSGRITHFARFRLRISQHEEELSSFVTQLGQYPFILGIPWLRQHDVNVRFRSNLLTFDSRECIPKHCMDTVTIKGIFSDSTKTTIATIDSTPVKQPTNDDQAEIRKRIPKEYHDYLRLFDKSSADVLPPRRIYDHRIPLKKDFVPPFGPLYSMSPIELRTLREWLDENLKKGFIRASSSPAASPVLFVKKKDGSLRVCVDYRGLNAGTIKNRYPLPLFQETIAQLCKARFFTKLDLRSAYNLVRIAKGEEWKTAFRTRFGLFESLVMPFGLCNAPATMQNFMNDVLRDYLDVFATAYLDDILIYSTSLEEHREHVRKVLQRLKEAGLYMKAEKCEFHQTEVEYLGMIISVQGIKMDTKKIATITEWPTPTSVRDVQSFLGFANFYRRFIKDYSRVVAPLTRLTRKNIPFRWSPQCHDAFNKLKSRFTTAPVLRHFDYDKEAIVETDASDYVSAGILSQHDEDGLLHPIAFFSKKHSPAECNYEIYDKELLAIVRAFEEWRPYLEGSPHPIKVITDHKNLEYFMTTKLLSRRQARWSEFLSRFDFTINYRPGKAGGKPDALTRRSGDLPLEEGDERELHRQQIVLKPRNLRLSATNSNTTTIEELWTKAYETDSFPNEIIELLRKGIRTSRKISLGECEEERNRLRYRGKLFVPNYQPLRLRIIQISHDLPAAGHPGRAKTFELIQRQYYWPTMRKDIDRYVGNCHTCKRSKATRNSPSGGLKSLPIPYEPWKDISMDFVVGLPMSNGFDAIWVVVDRLTKMRHLVPCRSDITARKLAELFVKNIFRLHGLPDTIVSDRGPQFASEFWTNLCHRLRIEPRLSTAFHPQTDGQTEITNASMEQYLRCYVDYLQDDWPQWLPIAEFAANNQVSESTKMSPFFANYGFDPKFHYDTTNSEETTTRAPARIDADTFASTMNRLFDHIRAEISRAQALQQEFADKRRGPTPSLKIGDMVWLDARNISTKRPSQKLDYKRLGPFRIKEKISTHAFRLELPPTMKVHDVFHVSKLDLVREDPYPGQIIPPPPPIEVDGEDEYFVDQILDSKYIGRGNGRQLRYLVKWDGYSEPTWEPANYVKDLDVVKKFHQRYPNKPGPKA